MAAPSPSFLHRLPKCELHSHIDGSVPIGELFKIARKNKRLLTTSKGEPIESVSAFVGHVKGSGYDSMLDEIVDRFFPITNLMQTEETLIDVGKAYVEELSRNNVTYAEGRFAPQYHTREGLSLGQAISSMIEGLTEGTESFGTKVNLIVAIGRESEAAFGEEVARAATSNTSVVGLDLGGPEAGNPPEKFGRAFSFAKERGIKTTVHAGEGAGSEVQNKRNIRSALTQIRADRIGHAIDLAKDETLVGLAAEMGITIEMNPVSNIVLRKIRAASDLRIDELMDKGVSVTVNSDDPAMWPNGTITDVLATVCAGYGFGMDRVDTLMENAIHGSFANPRDKEELSQAYLVARRRLA